LMTPAVAKASRQPPKEKLLHRLAKAYPLTQPSPMHAISLPYLSLQSGMTLSTLLT
jgi:hypothetical protein